MASALADVQASHELILDTWNLKLTSRRDMPLPDYLQEITKCMLEAPNWLPPEGYEHIPNLHCSTDFKVSAGRPETNLIASNLKEHLTNMRAFVAANPNYHLEVQNMTITLDDRLGRAIIFCTTKVSGLFRAGGVRQSINQIRTRRRKDGHWVAYELSSLREPGHLTF